VRAKFADVKNQLVKMSPQKRFAYKRTQAT